MYGKTMQALMRLKTLMLIYFSGGVFLTMAFDLVWTRTGVVHTALLWEIMLAAVLCALIQQLIYTENILQERPRAARVLLHLALTYGVMLSLAAVFRWMTLGFLSILIFTGVFLVLYSGLFFAISLFYRLENQRLNDKLEQYKSGGH